MIPKDTNYPAVIPYLTCGWPTPDLFLEAVQGVKDAGCPYLEIGFPFSDPIADGPTVQKTSAEALESGIDLDTCFELTRQATQKTGLPAVAMTYANLVFYHGVEVFCQRLKACGGAGLIVPDLSFEESQPVKEACARNDLDLISFVAPTSAPERRVEVASQATGFLYLVSVRGVTGGAATTVSEELKSLIRDLKSHSTAPVMVGFGIRHAQQVEQFIEQGADGVIVGSALLEAISEAVREQRSVGECVRTFLTPLVKAAIEPGALA